MRGLVKGGVWKNTEDEILKAAVMKYGKNQWARISSLLVRKTPKQCKARWYEWLDPSIKKTEWSREEEEKLLHLAKLMPCQWRTIAPMIGRTPAQCLEHYEKLLDQAQGRDEDMDKDDPRKLKPGEVDPTPETRPAKPDPVDMDEDEKEMLAEARARLANTQGKKAKRTAREKQLEEARRLASLQKKRELKAAGIEIHEFRRKRRGMDFNAEIPFEKKPAPGFYDTSEEKQKNKGKDFTAVTLQQMEGKRRTEIEEEARKRDLKKQKLMKDHGLLPSSQIAKLTQQSNRRSKLELPAPQIGENELEDIVKMANQQHEAIEETPNEASRALLANYAIATPRGAMRTPALQDRVMMEARNNLILRESQTPLLGKELEALHDIEGSFEGATPKREVHQTPNPMMTPRGSSMMMMTPRSGSSSVPQTPIRDQLQINQGFGQASIKQELRKGLMSLPKPRNEFEIVLPQLEDGEEGEGKERGEDRSEEWVEDAADIEEKRRKEIELAEMERLKNRSQAVQRDLPRPSILNKSMLTTTGGERDPELAGADVLIRQEMIVALNYDTHVYPMPGSKRPNQSETPEEVEKFSEEEMSSVVQLINSEIKGHVDYEEFKKVWEEISSDFMFIPSIQKYARASTFPKTDRIEALKNLLEINRGIMSNDFKKTTKIEQKLGILLGGYQNRAATLENQLKEIVKQINQNIIDSESFRHLAILETAAIPARIENLQKQVDFYARKESEFQRKYAQLLQEKESLLTLQSS